MHFLLIIDVESFCKHCDKTKKIKKNLIDVGVWSGFIKKICMFKVVSYVFS